MAEALSFDNTLATVFWGNLEKKKPVKLTLQGQEHTFSSLRISTHTACDV